MTFMRTACLYLVDPVNISHRAQPFRMERDSKAHGPGDMDAMKEPLATRPEDVIACVGPASAGTALKWAVKWQEKSLGFWARIQGRTVLPTEKGPKYQLDLWKANEIIFAGGRRAGKQIHTTEYLYHIALVITSLHRRGGEEPQVLCLQQSPY